MEYEDVAMVVVRDKDVDEVIVGVIDLDDGWVRVSAPLATAKNEEGQDVLAPLFDTETIKGLAPEEVFAIFPRERVVMLLTPSNSTREAYQQAIEALFPKAE